MAIFHSLCILYEFDSISGPPEVLFIQFETYVHSNNIANNNKNNNNPRCGIWKFVKRNEQEREYQVEPKSPFQLQFILTKSWESRSDWSYKGHHYACVRFVDWSILIPKSLRKAKLFEETVILAYVCCFSVYRSFVINKNGWRKYIFVAKHLKPQNKICGSCMHNLIIKQKKWCTCMWTTSLRLWFILLIWWALCMWLWGNEIRT